MPPRSSIIFWLLVAATFCADVAALYSLTNRRFDEMRAYYSLNAWSALALAQVSVTAIWLVFRPRHDVWSWLLPPAVLLAASYVRTQLGLLGPGWTTLDYVFRTAIQGLISIVVLWLLKRTPMWRKLAPAATQPKWDFSLRQLLLWTTITSVLSALIARATWNDGQPIAVSQAFGILAPPTIAVSVVVIALSRLHWLARIAGYLVVGAAVAMTLNYFLSLIITDRLWNITDRLLAEFVSEALMVAAWVEWGGIVPHPAITADNERAESQP
jgi:hypothetical protein